MAQPDLLLTLDWDKVRGLLSRHHNVYLMHDPRAGRVKVGRTGGCVFDRRAVIRSELGRSVFVMARLRARPSLETYLHRHFAPFRLEGEWFEDLDDLHTLARRFNALDVEVFGPRKKHPDDAELLPWIA